MLRVALNDSYPLRPEVIESMMYHDTVFGTGEMAHWGKMILHQLNNTRTKVRIGKRIHALSADGPRLKTSFRGK